MSLDLSDVNKHLGGATIWHLLATEAEKVHTSIIFDNIQLKVVLWKSTSYEIQNWAKQFCLQSIVTDEKKYLQNYLFNGNRQQADVWVTPFVVTQRMWY